MTTNEMPSEIWAAELKLESIARNYKVGMWCDESNKAYPPDQYFHHTLLTAKDAEIERLRAENAHLTDKLTSRDLYIKAYEETVSELRVAVREMGKTLKMYSELPQQEDGYELWYEDEGASAAKCLEKHKHLLNEQAKGE